MVCHEAVPQDTLWGISEEFLGAGWRYHEIVEANRLKRKRNGADRTIRSAPRQQDTLDTGLQQPEPDPLLV